MTEDKITIKELSDALNVSKTTVRNHVHKVCGELPVVEKGQKITLSVDIAELVRESIVLSKSSKSANLTANLTDNLNAKLPQTDFSVEETFEVLKKQLEEKDPLPDKEKNQMAWVRAANQHRAIAEEIILKELIYV